MKKRKPSFFERLTGNVSLEEYDDHDVYDPYDAPTDHRAPQVDHKQSRHLDIGHPSSHQHVAQSRQPIAAPIEGDLSVDVFQTEDEVVIKALVAGVRPDDVDVSITRDTVTIRGEREEDVSTTTDNYFHRELFWGAFSRTIILPAEVEVEEATAYEKHGILEIHLPKINRDKQTKLRIKSQ